MTEKEICEKIISNGGCLGIAMQCKRCLLDCKYNSKISIIKAKAYLAKQKEPSHEDIMKTDWKINEAYSYEFYQRPTKFRIGYDGEVQYLIEKIGWVTKDWFIGHESAQIPKEGLNE